MTKTRHIQADHGNDDHWSGYFCETKSDRRIQEDRDYQGLQDVCKWNSSS